MSLEIIRGILRTMVDLAGVHKQMYIFNAMPRENSP